MSNQNFLQAFISEFEPEEKVEAVKFQALIGYYWSGNKEYSSRDINVAPVLDKLITWEAAKPLLDYEWSNGYGAMDCHDVVIWTDKRIFYIHEYDGSTSIQWLSRNPE